MLKKKEEKAFTLIEVVVASALVALFMAGLYQVISLGFSVWERGQIKIDEQQNVRTALNHIVRELRTAHAYNIGSSSIEMKIPNSKDNFDTYRSIRYYLNDGNILRNVNGAGHNIVAYGIKDLQFISDPGSDLITITIVGESGFSVSTKAFVRVDKSFLFQQ